MNRPYKLRYLPLFWEDLSQAASYIAFDLNNPAAANRLVDNVEAGILEHLKNPTMSQHTLRQEGGCTRITASTLATTWFLCRHRRRYGSPPTAI